MSAKTEGIAPNASRLLWAGFMAILAAGVGFAIRGGIFDNWGKEFGFTAAQLGAIGGAGFTGFCFGIIGGGVIVDKIGYGKLVVVALLCHILSAFVTFGAAIPAAECNPQSRTDVLALTRLIRARISGLYKVLPTAVFAAAMRPSIAKRDLEARIDQILEELAARRANLGVTSGRQAIAEAAEPLETRGIIVLEGGRFRVRERSVLRYYARSIEHLLATPGRTH